MSEDEPTRASGDRPSTAAVEGQVVDTDAGPTGRWVLLAEAEDEVGMSRSWLRKQIAKGRLPAREVKGPTGTAWSVPLDRARELARATTERAHPAEHGPAREVVLAREVERLHERFDAWTRQLDGTWHGLAHELADARERAGSAEARARTADEVADLLRAEVQRLREETERLRAQETRSRWWKRRTG